MDVHDQHPSPWPQDETEAGPPTVECRAEARKSCERADGALEPLLRVLRHAVGPYQPVQVVGGRRGDLDPWHALEVVQVNRPPGPGVVETFMGALQCLWQAVQERGHVARIGIGVVQRV